jgi:hypothetical protein
MGICMVASALFASMAVVSLIRGRVGATWLAIALSISCFGGGIAEAFR